jgi:transposase
MSDFFWFSDTQRARVEPLLPANARGKKRVDDRRLLSGIVHALRFGGRSIEVISEKFIDACHHRHSSN